MNRRGFLGTVAAIGVVPLPAVAAPGTFVWAGPERFDFGFQMAMSLTLPDGRRMAARTEVPRRNANGKWPRRPDEKTVAELKQTLLDWAAKQYGVAA
jgi:hypothetical protein